MNAKPEEQTKGQNLYAVEFTDTFGGEANYCWSQRFTVRAANITQAITRAKQHRYNAPLPRHKLSLYDNDEARIDLVKSPVCAFINRIDQDEYNAENHGEIIN